MARHLGGAAALEVDGILTVDKPAGMTSHDVVHKIRRQFRIAKVGHGGTLDPNATGLLLILLGKGTRLSERIMGGDKRYQGVMRLGRVTTTQDCDGEVIAENPWTEVTQQALATQFQAFTGDLFQTPPMVSAVKVNGVPLYKLARKGQEVQRKQRFVHVYRFVLEAWQPPLVEFTVDCTKGTYIRTLAHDIGQELGCGAALDGLRRLQSGTFKVSEAHALDEILQLTFEQFVARVIPMVKLDAARLSPQLISNSPICE